MELIVDATSLNGSRLLSVRARRRGRIRDRIGRVLAEAEVAWPGAKVGADEA